MVDAELAFTVILKCHGLPSSVANVTKDGQCLLGLLDSIRILISHAVDSREPAFHVCEAKEEVRPASGFEPYLKTCARFRDPSLFQARGPKRTKCVDAHAQIREFSKHFQRGQQSVFGFLVTALPLGLSQP